MKLYETFQKSGYHTTLMTSFGVEFDAFESIVVRRLRSAECRNIILVCDSGMLGLALADASRPPRAAGANYLLAKRSAAGVFHPKLVVQIGADRGRLIVASANATAAGLAGNLELATVVECGPEDSPERRLLLSAWRYAAGFLDRRQGAVEDKLRWAADRSPWLASGVGAEGPVTLPDGSIAAFLASGSGTSIGARFVDLVGARARVERLTIVSPYWDPDLGALRSLQNELRPRETVLAIDPAEALFPKHAAKNIAATKIVSIRELQSKQFDEHNSRFVHAKLIVATVGNVDHILVGSANCTTAALGNMVERGINEEACLYRRIPRGAVTEALGLKTLLEEGSKLSVDQIPDQKPQPQLPLGEAEANDPGHFELAYERLHWWPSSPRLAELAASRKAGVELFDDRLRALDPPEASLVHAQGRFELALVGQSCRPALARVKRADGSVTGLAVVASVGELRSQTRDPVTARTERALRELRFGDDEGLWLLEVIQTLSPERAGVAKSDRQVRAASSRRADEQPEAPRQLDFESFMRGRRRDLGSAETGRNSLAGGHVSYVRAALNRLLGMADARAEDRDDLDSDVTDALDTGDETRGAGHAVDEGFDPDDPTQSAKAAARRERRRRAADAESIAAAVEAFAEEMRDPHREIGPVEMLRLRAVLMVVAVAGWSGKPGDGTTPTANQVLPCSDPNGGATWPREIGKALAPFFMGNPAIRRLQFDTTSDRLSDDMLEEIACCIWASEAALAAAQREPECRRLLPFLVKLNETVHALLPLSRSELASSSFAKAIELLDARFGPRLRIPPLQPSCHRISGGDNGGRPAFEGSKRAI